jgi:two-component sensor histidine kinase
LFLIGVIAVVPSFIGLVLNEIEMRRARLEEIQSEAMRNSALAASELKQIVDGARAVLQAVSLAPPVRGSDEEACRAYLKEIDEQVDPLAAIIIVNLDGKTRCRPDAMDLADRDYFKEALSRRGLVVGRFVVGRISSRPRLPVAVPMVDREGRISGVIAGALDLDWLGKQIQHRALAPGSALTIADRDGTIVARQPYPERFVGTRIPDGFQPLVNGTSPGIQNITSQDGTKRLIGYIPPAASGIDLYVSAGSASSGAYSSIESAAVRGFFFLGIGCLSALLLAWWFGRSQIRRPVERILMTTERWHAGDYAARTGLAAQDGEIEATGEALDGLADQLEKRETERNAAARQRELLIQELNHRVKNVLAVVQSIASSTLRRDMPPERLQEFERRLGAIARSHELLTTNHWEESGLDEIVEAVVTPLCGADRHRVRAEGPSLVLQPIPALSMSMLLHELCTNALKYGALSTPGGYVTIAWDEPASGEGYRLTWQEIDGPAVTAPTHQGFGSRLIATLARRLGGTASMRYEPEGVFCVVTFHPTETRSGTAASAVLARSQAE